LGNDKIGGLSGGIFLLFEKKTKVDETRGERSSSMLNISAPINIAVMPINIFFMRLICMLYGFYFLCHIIPVVISFLMSGS